MVTARSDSQLRAQQAARAASPGRTVISTRASALRRIPATPPQVVFQLRQARRRIQRHRDTTRVQRTVERGEEVASGRQHDGHRVSGAVALVGQARRDRERVDAQPSHTSGASPRRARESSVISSRSPWRSACQSSTSTSVVDRIGRVLDPGFVAFAMAPDGARRRRARSRGRRGDEDAQQIAGCLGLRQGSGSSERHAQFAFDPQSRAPRVTGCRVHSRARASDRGRGVNPAKSVPGRTSSARSRTTCRSRGARSWMTRSSPTSRIGFLCHLGSSCWSI